MTPAEKFTLGRLVRARKDVRVLDRLIFAAALDYLNCKTGRCDPGAKTLAVDVAVSERTVRRGLERLQAKRLVWIQERRGRTPMLRFPLSTGTDSHLSAPTPDSYVSAPSAPPDPRCRQMAHEVRTNGAIGADSYVSDEPRTIEPLDGDASPLPRKGEASASREKPQPSGRAATPDGFQGEHASKHELNGKSLDPLQPSQEERERQVARAMKRLGRA